MGVPVYVINPEEFGKAVAEYLGKDITINTGDIELDTSELTDLLQQIKDKIPTATDLDLTDLISALNDLNVKITNLSDNLQFTGVQKIYGQSLEIPNEPGEYIIEFEINKTGKLTGITYSQSAWNYEDKWDLIIGDLTVFNSIYTKEYGENKPFYTFYNVNTGDKVYFKYYNNSSSSKVLWVDLEILESDTV